MQNPWKSYRQVATQTASPGHLVLMLFDGAIRFLDRAIPAFDEDDPLQRNQTINNNLTRAIDILNELNCALNLKEGGEFARNMRALYEYMVERLMKANLHKTSAEVIEVLTRITVLRQAWSEMLQGRNAPALTAPEDKRQSVLAAA